MLHPNILAARHREEALRAIRNHKFDYTENGIAIPSMKLAIGGVFEVAGGDGVFEVCPNLIPTEGLNHIIGVALNQATQKLAFYLGLFSGDVTVQPTWTGANWVANATGGVHHGRRRWHHPWPGARRGQRQERHHRRHHRGIAPVGGQGDGPGRGAPGEIHPERNLDLTGGRPI